VSDNPLTNVGRVELDLASRTAKPDTVQTNGAALAKTQSSSDGDSQQVSAGQKVKDSKPEKVASALADVSLKFQIDAKTNDVTIFILDKASRQVVRTIPPEEMKKMGPGELLELFA
jgi:uncharacterized FlaG/YvyC family protein